MDGRAVKISVGQQLLVIKCTIKCKMEIMKCFSKAEIVFMN